MMPWLVCIVTFFTPTAALLAAYQMVIFWYAAVDTHTTYSRHMRMTPGGKVHHKVRAMLGKKS